MLKQESYFYFFEAEFVSDFWDKLAGCNIWDSQYYGRGSDWVLNPLWETFGQYNLLLRRFSTSKFIIPTNDRFFFSSNKR